MYFNNNVMIIQCTSIQNSVGKRSDRSGLIQNSLIFVNFVCLISIKFEIKNEFLVVIKQ